MNLLLRTQRFFFALILLLAGASAATGQSLQSRIDALARSEDLGKGVLCVSVIDLADGLTVAELNPNRPVSPASNLKLVTTAAALATLKSDMRFTTQLLYQDGKLIVVGEGDPAFGDPKILAAMNLTVEDLLDRWVAAVQRAGIKKIDQVIVDDRIFDAQQVHPDWPANQLNLWYCAPVSGLNFYNNCVAIFAAPTSPGESPRIKTEPLNAPISLTTLAHTGKENALAATREPDTNRITLRGSVSSRSPSLIFNTIHDPALFFGQTLAQRLNAAGIPTGPVVHADDLLDVRKATLLAEVKTPLTEIIARCNKDSQNLFAESLLKYIGHHVTGAPGSWANGAAAARMALARLAGPGAAGFVLHDGSGLSKDDRVTTALMAQLLLAMHRQPQLGEIYQNCLAVGGIDGTLKNRFKNPKLVGQVHAKSGYITGVIALSGYIRQGDKGYAFSIILNDFNRPVYKGKRLIDRIVRAADATLAGKSVEQTPADSDNAESGDEPTVE